MSEFIADFHIHSKYSRATSRNMDIETLAAYAKLKGIALIGTGDFTHPLWLLELKDKLKPQGSGLYEYNGVNFVLTAEVSNIFYRNNRAKKVHNIIFTPSIEAAEKMSAKLSRFGNLSADGRPILNVEAADTVETALSVDKNSFVVPSHAWTPHFSVFGSNSGFNSIEECFGGMASEIYCLETGLSSDPAMNWRLSQLDKYTLISNSDAHSPAKIGREANVLDCAMDYNEIINALKTKDRAKFLYTIEFFPEEGKYHYDGHRVCGQPLSPRETRKNKNLCPVCLKPVTVGVMNRVEELADREEGFIPKNAIPFRSMIPLLEIIAEAKGKGVDTEGVRQEYNNCIQRLGAEFEILLKIPEDKLRKNLSEKIAEGIIRVRNGKVKIEPGYDGEYGKIKIFSEEEKQKEKQLTLF